MITKIADEPSYASSIRFAKQLRVFCGQGADGEPSKKRLDMNYLIEVKEIMRLRLNSPTASGLPKEH